jgi:hypothetical protein
VEPLFERGRFVCQLWIWVEYWYNVGEGAVAGAFSSAYFGYDNGI